MRWTEDVQLDDGSVITNRSAEIDYQSLAAGWRRSRVALPRAIANDPHLDVAFSTASYDEQPEIPVLPLVLLGLGGRFDRPRRPFRCR